MDTAVLMTQISMLPDSLKEEVADFVGFLQQKLKTNTDNTKLPERKFGCGKGSFVMSPDFDEPLEEFKDYM